MEEETRERAGNQEAPQATRSKPKWRRGNLMIALRDAMKSLKNNKTGVDFSTILKFISRESDTPPVQIRPRLNDVLHMAQHMGMVTQAKNGSYIYEDKDFNLCGVCGGMKKRRKKSRCGTKRRRSKSRRSKSRCGGKTPEE
uniref:Uncharacterized protein n=1 Tax=Lygus hesperus TaxID=30085 RepID=A0A0K8T5B7_LYGHE